MGLPAGNISFLLGIVAVCLPSQSSGRLVSCRYEGDTGLSLSVIFSPLNAFGRKPCKIKCICIYVKHWCRRFHSLSSIYLPSNPPPVLALTNIMDASSLQNSYKDFEPQLNGFKCTFILCTPAKF
jgi:hypothetical protein